MRTTLTLDDDVAAQIQRLRDERQLPLKDIVNDALRLGLSRLDKTVEPTTKRYTFPMNLGQPLVSNVDDIAEILAFAEGEAYR